VQILERLVAGRVVSPIDLAGDLGVTQSVARYHLHRLERLGVVGLGARPAGGSARHYYHLTDREATTLALERPDDLAHLAARSRRGVQPKAARGLFALGGALRAMREARGVTISDLAYCAGLTPAVLERIECGEADPRSFTPKPLRNPVRIDGYGLPPRCSSVMRALLLETDLVLRAGCPGALSSRRISPRSSTSGSTSGGFGVRSAAAGSRSR
jgi:DNA-binding transcriptional ArsR family regulator